MLRNRFVVLVLVLCLSSVTSASSAKAALCYGPWTYVSWTGWGPLSQCTCGPLVGIVSVDVTQAKGMISAQSSTGSGQVVIELGEYYGAFAQRAADHFWYFGNANSWTTEDIRLYDSDEFHWNANYRAVCMY